ncbi:MAG: methyltransferase domain-containing protein [Planctomycetes bacterium]|nr:methyltransferase domain-containing protein [Planctomycetota bacterium]MCB9904258.1 methyltransferase domain-containing protein [Planctomycetota bacterium]
MDDTTRMPFDQYQRYRLVADVLENVRPEGERLEVLDVGGRTALLRRFMPEDRVELVDVEESDETGLVIGSGAQLPFQDGAFDAVVCFDTLEHVPPPLRDAFVDECARVARRWVVIAGPYHTEEVARSEELLQEFIHEKLGEKHRYLQEHRDHGLPDRKETESRLRAAGARVRSIGHARLDRWLGLMCLSLYMDRDAALRGIASGFHQFYNEALYASDHAKTVYRHAVVAAFGKAALPKPEDLLGPPVAPKGSLKPVDNLVRELLAFDSQRDVVRAEWDRLERVNRDLEKDLAEHEASLADVRRELAERDRVIEAKDAGLADLKARVDATQGAAEDSTAVLKADLAEHAATIKTLNADLAEHKKTIDSLRVEVEAKSGGISALEGELARERAAGAAERQHLRSELEHHATSLAELSRLRGELQHVVGELESIVADKDVALAALDAELTRERAEGGHVREVLSRDLEAHKLHSAALETERDEFAKEVSRLVGMLREERELRRTREQSTHAGLEMHQELMREQEELYQRKRSDAAQLEDDLNQHHAVLNQLREELEESLANREARETQLRAEIERHDAAVSALTKHLQEAQESLESERREMAALREELNDRWRSLLRAIKPKRESD